MAQHIPELIQLFFAVTGEYRPDYICRFPVRLEVISAAALQPLSNVHKIRFAVKFPAYRRPEFILRLPENLPIP